MHTRDRFAFARIAAYADSKEYPQHPRVRAAEAEAVPDEVKPAVPARQPEAEIAPVAPAVPSSAAPQKSKPAPVVAVKLIAREGGLYD